MTMTPHDADRGGFIDDRRLTIVQARAAAGKARRSDVLALCAELRTAREERDAALSELEGTYAAIRMLTRDLDAERAESLNGD